MHGSTEPNSIALVDCSQICISVTVAELLGRCAAELALFAGAGFLIFGINDLLVDCIYFGRRLWRSATIYKRFPRAFASYWVFNKNPSFFAIFVPAWDESAVIAPMLKAMLSRLDYDDYRIFVGYYRNDPLRLLRSPASPIPACTRSRSRPTGRPPRRIASTTSTMRWSPMSWTRAGRRRPWSCMMQRTWSTVSSCASSTG